MGNKVPALPLRRPPSNTSESALTASSPKSAHRNRTSRCALVRGQRIESHPGPKPDQHFPMKKQPPGATRVAEFLALYRCRRRGRRSWIIKFSPLSQGDGLTFPSACVQSLPVAPVPPAGYDPGLPRPRIRLPIACSQRTSVHANPHTSRTPAQRPAWRSPRHGIP
jgi:hypothetical protein